MSSVQWQACTNVWIQGKLRKIEFQIELIKIKTEHLGYLSIFKNIFEQNGERPNGSISPKDLKSKISDDLAQK